MRRRNFLKDTAVGLTGFAAMGGVKANAQQGLRVDQTGDIGNTFKTGWGDGIGRPVRIASIGFKDGSLPLEKMAALVDKEGTHGPDVIVLPELCRGQERESECRCMGRPSRPWHLWPGSTKPTSLAQLTEEFVTGDLIP